MFLPGLSSKAQPTEVNIGKGGCAAQSGRGRHWQPAPAPGPAPGPAPPPAPSFTEVVLTGPERCPSWRPGPAGGGGGGVVGVEQSVGRGVVRLTGVRDSTAWINARVGAPHLAASHGGAGAQPQGRLQPVGDSTGALCGSPGPEVELCPWGHH